MTLKHTFVFMFAVSCMVIQVIAQEPAKPVASNPAYKQAKATAIGRLELNDSTISEAARLISEITQVNIVATEAAGEKTLSVYLRDIKAIDAVETICKVCLLYTSDAADE